MKRLGTVPQHLKTVICLATVPQRAVPTLRSLLAPALSMAQRVDYTAWEHADLVQRVHELEKQLQRTTREINVLTERENTRDFRPFDASKHATRKIALKFAYLGANYNGLEHHNANVTPLPAVEKVLWRALVKTRLISPQWKDGEHESLVSWDGCEYSKCGRTDKGVSSFGQVVGLRVRSSRPLPRQSTDVDDEQNEDVADEVLEPQKPFDPVKDELPYVYLLNKVLPPDIRALAWCADVPSDFDARFSCRERRYRYFFTDPCFVPVPGREDQRERWLDIDAMRLAAKKYEGLHDFRNFCKIDGSKQITSFQRRIFRAEIHADEHASHAIAGAPSKDIVTDPKLYYFEVRGSAFLWHQVRHLVAILFLIGQGLEKPDVIDCLLDVENMPAKPQYQMASDAPLVLWDCIFPDLTADQSDDHSEESRAQGYTDSLRWLYANDTPPPSMNAGMYSGDQRYSREGVMETLWSHWRERKLQEVLASQLITRIANEGPAGAKVLDERPRRQPGARTFEGGDTLRGAGAYIPLALSKKHAATPAHVNAQWLARNPHKRRPAKVEQTSS